MCPLVGDHHEPLHHYCIWSEYDGAWVADVPDLKSCAAFGDAREQAVAEVGIAIEAWIAAAREAGLDISELADIGRTTRQRKRANGPARRPIQQ